MNINKNIVFCLLAFFTSCSKQPAGDLDQSLQLAGDNRSELESVLDHYSQEQSDSLKYKAAVFLIENMVYYHSYEGEQLDNYLSIYESVATSYKEPQAVLDSFVSVFGHFSVNDLRKKHDIEEVKASYLIDNIEWAFKVWEEQPWGKNVTFDNFCEYILPYRIENEKLVPWRQNLYEKYNHLLDPYRNTNEILDPLFAAKIIIDSLYIGERHFTTFLPDLPHIGSALCEQWRAGTCRELTDLTIYVLRALGIPCGIDFMPVHARVSAGHLWTFILNCNGDTYTSDYLDPDIGVLSAQDVQHITSKIYRKTFSLNRQLTDKLPASVPLFFRQPRFRDVTSHYVNRNPVRTVSIPASTIYKSARNSYPCYYLCVPFEQGWTPVDRTNNRSGKIQFDHVKSDIVFRVGIWENDQMMYITDVIKVCGLNGNESVLTLDENNRNPITVFSKCNIDSDEEFGQFMIEGVFEGSNHPDFANADTLFIIKKRPMRLENVVYLDTTRKYRYIRYVSPGNSHCDVAEISFYKNRNSTEPYTGKILGTPNRQPHDRNEYTNAFDGNNYTSFHHKEASGGWVGLDLGEPKSISHLVYVPRNRDNFIRRGDEYELFYFDKSWFSFGRKVATADSLVFENVPSNILLYLKNQTRGKQERPFTYENGEQIWW